MGQSNGKREYYEPSRMPHTAYTSAELRGNFGDVYSGCKPYYNKHAQFNMGKPCRCRRRHPGYPCPVRPCNSPRPDMSNQHMNMNRNMVRNNAPVINNMSNNGVNGYPKGVENTIDTNEGFTNLQFCGPDRVPNDYSEPVYGNMSLMYDCHGMMNNNMGDKNKDILKNEKGMDLGNKLMNMLDWNDDNTVEGFWGGGFSMYESDKHRYYNKNCPHDEGVILETNKRFRHCSCDASNPSCGLGESKEWLNCDRPARPCDCNKGQLLWKADGCVRKL